MLRATLGLALLIGLSGLALGAYGLWNHQADAASRTSLAVSSAPGEAGSVTATPVASPTPSATTAGSLSDPTSQQSAPPAKPAASTTLARTTTKATTKAATTATTKAQTTAPAGNASYEQQVLTLTNAQRAATGCPALTWNSTLASVARAHSQDMAAKGYFDHNTLSGTTSAQRLSSAGYAYRLMAENIAAGQATPSAVMTSWMGSAGHKANILNCSLKELGVGYATGGPYGSYWTQDFGTR